MYLVFHNNRNDEVNIAADYIDRVEPVHIGSSVLTRITLYGGDEAVVREDVEAVRAQVAEALTRAA